MLLSTGLVGSEFVTLGRVFDEVETPRGLFWVKAAVVVEVFGRRRLSAAMSEVRVVDFANDDTAMDDLRGCEQLRWVGEIVDALQNRMDRDDLHEQAIGEVEKILDSRAEAA